MAGTPRGLLLAIVLLVAGTIVPASAKDYTVGDTSGSTFIRLRLRGYLMNGKSSDRGLPVFAICIAAFQYSSAHSVLEVSEADHSACSASNPLRSHRDQSTTVPLTKPGTRYFICGAPGHCASGMKLTITVSGGGSDSGSSAGPAMRAMNTTPAAGGATTTTCHREQQAANSES
ncbi:unnamed protein product [Miscanthus lutarioriparius]|uniref:Phytocyanin domain-containing protein n=1 Tax=Miscanthus lutarioriparius TaxID=422564 RepID=A0A811R0I9_9POAL|nr:unnamed protein product [Miscanthus lutarioriparius]